MVRKEKKDFTKAKKFMEIQKERKSKLLERSIQKKTSYERDIRTMTKSILEPLRLAETGEAEITRDEINKIRARLEKIIIRIRILSGNKGANLSSILAKVQGEKALILDYLHGKRELPGLVKQKGEKPSPAPSAEKPVSDNGQREKSKETSFSSFSHLGFDDRKTPIQKSKEDFYKSLGFDDLSEEEEEEIIEVKPVMRKETHPTPSIQTDYQPTEAFRRMSLNLIDDKISQIISQGIEHLMLIRKKRGKVDVNYRDEIIKFIDDEMIYIKNRTIDELKNKGYNDSQMQYFIDLYDKEFELNMNLIIRKCLYLSRVLEYRKGSTSSG